MRSRPRVWLDEAALWVEAKPGAAYNIQWTTVSRVTIGRVGRPPFVDYTIELDDDSGNYLEINDAMDGFSDALRGICERYASTCPDWERAVSSLAPSGPAVEVYRRFRDEV
jgi:hypothetical protein